MWLSQYLHKLFSFTIAYFRTLGRSAFDLVHENVITKSQFGRFYWVSLLICAFALYYYYLEAQQYGGTSVDHPECYLPGDLPFFAFFVLAEIASFVLLTGARFAGWGMVRIWTADALVLDENLQARSSPLTRTQRAHVITRRLYGEMWGWFPITLALAVLISGDKLGSVVDDCFRERHLSSIGFVTTLIWPGLVVAFVIVAASNWLLFRWRWNLRSAFILSLIFVFYLISIALAGPADRLLGRGFAAMPSQINWLSTVLFGGAFFNVN